MRNLRQCESVRIEKRGYVGRLNLWRGFIYGGVRVGSEIGRSVLVPSFISLDRLMPSDCGNGRLGLGLVGAISGSLGFLNFDFG